VSKLKVFGFVLVMVLLLTVQAFGWPPSGQYGYGSIAFDQGWCNWKKERGTVSFSQSSVETLFSESADICPNSNYCKAQASESASYQVLGTDLLSLNDAQLVFSKDESLLLATGAMAAGQGGPLLAVGAKKGSSTSSPDGEYYLMYYERDFLGVDKGQNRLSMGIAQFSGNVLTTNEKLACNGTQCVNGYYSGLSLSYSYKVEADGTLKGCLKEGGPCQDSEYVPVGYIGSDGKLAIITIPAEFYPYTADDFMLLVSMKKGDKQYFEADLEGKWVIGGFGDEEGTVVGMLGIMNCNNAGACSGTMKKYTKSMAKVESFNTTFSVDQSGSINGFENGPSYDTLRGAIGNNGNTVLLGIGRLMMVGVKTDAPLSISGLTLKKGWNLVGLISGNSKDIKELVQGKEDKMQSVWKWVQSKQGWAVYLPQQEKQNPGATSTYAGQKGFDIISNINPGEGFWINVINIGDNESIVIDY